MQEKVIVNEMIQLNPRYEAIFNLDNIDHEGCG